jgi:hypothetical protein
MRATSLASSRAPPVPARKIPIEKKAEVAMYLDLEEDFEYERWSLLALVDARKRLSDGSECATTTDLMILAARELIRKYETLKGYWSRKPSPRRQRRTNVGQLVCIEASQASGRRSDSNKAPQLLQ